MSRSLLKNCRVYDNGYDLSGISRSIGPIKWENEKTVFDPMSDAFKSALGGQATIGFGTLNVLFDNTALIGAHARLSTPGGKHTVIVAMGMESAPANNGIAAAGQFLQKDYPVDLTASPQVMSIDYDSTYNVALSNLLYASPWGVLLHANGAETGANSTTYHDGLASSATGGFMVYQVLNAIGTGNITAAIKVQDSATTTDGDFTDLLTSGTINCGSGGAAVPTSGLVALSPTATVKRYTRWQLSLTLATSVTFVLAFCRG